jgi:cytochrome c-type biogenesis protein CcmF
LRVTQDSQKQMITGHFTLFRNGKEVAKMYPARWFFNKHEEPTTEVAIRRRFAEDFYLNMPSYQVKEKTASLEITINPLVNWIWLGFAVMAIGTGIVLLPERTFAFAMAKFPSPEVATTATAMVLALSLAAPAFAQHEEVKPTDVLPTYSAVEKDIQAGLICLCGSAGCGKKIVSECTCAQAAELRSEIAGLVKQGKTKDEVFAHYVAKYGSQEVLAAPVDKGFNRLAWLFPYAAASCFAIAGIFAIRKWSRRPVKEPTSADVTPVADGELQARLDRELEELN